MHVRSYVRTNASSTMSRHSGAETKMWSLFHQTSLSSSGVIRVICPYAYGVCQFGSLGPQVPRSLGPWSLNPRSGPLNRRHVSILRLFVSLSRARRRHATPRLFAGSRRNFCRQFDPTSDTKCGGLPCHERSRQPNLGK